VFRDDRLCGTAVAVSTNALQQGFVHNFTLRCIAKIRISMDAFYFSVWDYFFWGHLSNPLLLFIFDVG
jgi:hypothetical protein